MTAAHVRNHPGVIAMSVFYVILLFDCKEWRSVILIFSHGLNNVANDDVELLSFYEARKKNSKRNPGMNLAGRIAVLFLS